MHGVTTYPGSRNSVLSATRRTLRTFRTFTVAALACLFLIPCAEAQNAVWNAGDGSWFTGSNWNPNGVPAFGQEIWINNSGTARIGTTGAVAGTLVVGSNATGTLVIENGGTLLNGSASYIGRLAGSVGIVTVTGTGSSWGTSNNLIVGSAGTGTFNILNGGSFSLFHSGVSVRIGGITGGAGTINVSGAGSTFSTSQILTIGSAAGGTGTFAVAAAGVASLTGGVEFTGSGGTIQINGTSGSRGVLLVSTIVENVGATGAIDFNGGILRANSTQGNMLQSFESGDVSLLAGGGFIDTNSFNIGIASVIDGVGGLTKLGTGILTLSGANTYSGVTTIEAGTLKAGAAGGLANNGAFVLNGGTLDLGGHSLTATSLTGVAGTTVLVDGAGTSRTLTLNLATDQSYEGTISGTNQAVFLKTGVGNFTAANISFAGSTVRVDGGTLSTSGGAHGSQNVQLGTATGQDGTLSIDGGTWTNSGTVKVGVSGTGTLIVEGGAVFNHTATTASGNVPVFGELAGSSGSLVVSGAGSIFRSLNNAIVIGSAGTGSLTVSDGGKVSVPTPTAIIAVGGTGPGSVNVGAATGETPRAPGILDVERINNSSAASSALVLNHTASAYYLTRDGTASGTAIQLTGALKVLQDNGVTFISGVNTYTGGTTVSGGTLLVTNTSGSATGTGQVIVQSGAAFGGSGSVAGQVNAHSGATITPGQGGIGNLFVNGLLLQSGAKLLYDLGPGSTSDHIQVGLAGVGLLGPVEFQFLDAGVTAGPLSYTLMSGTAVSGLDLTLLSYSTSLIFDHAGFEISGSDLLFTGLFSGFYGGSTLQNSGPINVPATGNFLVQGAVQTGSPAASNTINSLQFAPGSSLQVFNNLTVTSGDFTVELGTATIFGGNIIVPGDFSKLGAGSLFANSNFQVAGNSYVQQGSLHVNGVFQTNALYVLPGALLGGNGTIVGNVFNSGTVAPGNSIGTLTILGDFTQRSNGTLQIEIGSLNSFDRLIVSGTARLGGTLEVKASASKLKYGQQYPFLQAGKITGKFSRIEMPRPSIFRGRFVNAGQVGILLVAPTSYTLVANTPNETRLARALDKWIGIEEGDIGEVTLALDVLAEEQYAQAFQAIMPEYYASAANTAVELSHNAGQMLHQHLSARRLAQRAAATAPAPAPSVPPIEVRKAIVPVQPVKFVEGDWNAWVQGSGMFSQGGLSLTPDENFESGTFFAGADYALDKNVSIGLFAGYQESWGDYADGGEVDSESVKFGAYLTYDNDGYYANAIVGGGTIDFDVRRPIQWAALSRAARSQPEATEFFTLLGGGRDFYAGGFTFGPQFSVQYTRVNMRGFAESGADSLDLRVDDFDTESLRSSLGMRVAYTWRINERLAIIPELRAFWQHEFMQDSQTIHSTLDGGSGPGFDYSTLERDRDTLFIGAGLGLQIGPRFYMSLYYNADFGVGDDMIHTVSINANWNF